MKKFLLGTVVFAAALLALQGASPAKSPAKSPANLLNNPSFNKLDAKGNPVGWANSKGNTIIKGKKSNQIHIKDRIFQFLTHKNLWQSAKPRKIQYSFKASGKGKLKVNFYRYSDVKDPKAKHGYTRKFLPGAAGGTFTLTDKPQEYKGTYTIAANEWAAIAFDAQDAIVDEVNVILMK